MHTTPENRSCAQRSKAKPFVGGISMSHSSTSMRSRSKTLCASFTLYAVNTCSTGIFFQFTPVTMLSTTSGWSSTINTFIR